MRALNAKMTTFFRFSAADMAESEFEKIVLNSLDSWLSEFHCFKFKALIQSDDYGSARPDILLIDREYREWLIIEVEMTRHSLHSHVVPQVKVFKDGRFGPSFAKKIHASAPFLDIKKLESMLRGDPPEVIVIAEAFLQEWDKCLRRERAHYLFVETFKSFGDDFALVFNGQFPRLKREQVSTLITDNHVPSIARLTNPAPVIGQLSSVDIFIDGTITRWSTANDGDSAWIVCDTSPPLKPNRSYKILINHQSKLEVFTEDDNEI